MTLETVLQRNFLALSLLAFSSVAAAASTPERAPWPALAQLARSGAQVSAAAIDLDNDHALDELHPDTHLTPASLTKLVTAAAALNQWPPDKVFHTRLLATGAIVDGELRGDLLLLGAGDPSLDDQSFWSLAAQLRGAGVTRVSGRLLVIPAPFGAVGCETQDRCHGAQRPLLQRTAGCDRRRFRKLVHPGAAARAGGERRGAWVRRESTPRY